MAQFRLIPRRLRWGASFILGGLYSNLGAFQKTYRPNDDLGNLYFGQSEDYDSQSQQNERNSKSDTERPGLDVTPCDLPVFLDIYVMSR